jgi:hypothetical protein
MSNVIEPHPSITFTLCSNTEGTDDNTPQCLYNNNSFIEVWSDIQVNAEGWDAQSQNLTSTTLSSLTSNTNYWLIAQSKALCGYDGVWVIGSSTGFVASKDGESDWASGEGGALELSVYGIVM